MPWSWSSTSARGGDCVRSAGQRRPARISVRKGSRRAQGEVLLEAGAQAGIRGDRPCWRRPDTKACRCSRKPRVAIARQPAMRLWRSAETPLDFQIRNSNAWSLAAQVARAGGCPADSAGRARRESAHARTDRARPGRRSAAAVRRSLGREVRHRRERVLADLGAEFFFDRVLISRGSRWYLARARGKFFFGLPGNPASTMVTFEIFARAAVELLGGASESALPLRLAQAAREFRQKPGLTRFLPARLEPDGSEVTPVPWQGSGDVPALARANAFLVAEADRESWAAGDWIRVLIEMKKKLTHYDDAGAPRMVDVSAKPPTAHGARACVCAHAARRARSFPPIPRAIRWKSRASPASRRPRGPRS